jgi:hypothetical protein
MKAVALTDDFAEPEIVTGIVKSTPDVPGLTGIVGESGTLHDSALIAMGAHVEKPSGSR